MRKFFASRGEWKWNVSLLTKECRMYYLCVCCVFYLKSPMCMNIVHIHRDNQLILVLLYKYTGYYCVRVCVYTVYINWNIKYLQWWVWFPVNRYRPLVCVRITHDALSLFSFGVHTHNNSLLKSNPRARLHRTPSRVVAPRAAWISPPPLYSDRALKRDARGRR